MEVTEPSKMSWTEGKYSPHMVSHGPSEERGCVFDSYDHTRHQELERTGIMNTTVGTAEMRGNHEFLLMVERAEDDER